MRIHIAVLLLSFGIAPLVVGVGTAQASPASEAFVKAAYTVILHRAADPNGLSIFTQQLDAESLTRQQVVQLLLNSEEFRSNEVNAVYQAFLRRPVDAVALGTMVNLLGQGTPITRIETLVASSPEYYQNQGKGSDQGFVVQLYQDALGRQASGLELVPWLGILQRAGTSPTAAAAARGQVATGIIVSTEGCTHWAALFWKGFPLLGTCSGDSTQLNFTTAYNAAAATVGSSNPTLVIAPRPLNSPIPQGPGKLVLVGLSGPITFQSITQPSTTSFLFNAHADAGGVQSIAEAWSPANKWRNHTVSLGAANGSFELTGVTVPSFAVSGNSLTFTLNFARITQK